MRLPASFCVFLSFLVHESTSQEFNITPIKTSSGLYYEKIGDVLLSNSNWEFVTSVDYAGYLLFYQYLQDQAQKLHEFCQEYQSSYCEERYDQIETEMNKMDETNEIMANLFGIKTENGKVDIPWSNISKGTGEARMIFGDTKDQVDLSGYDRQLVALQYGGRNFQNLLDQQTTLFSNKITSLNHRSIEEFNLFRTDINFDPEQFDEQLDHIYSIRAQIELKQKHFLQIINNAKNGSLDPSILDPLGLLRMVEDIPQTYLRKVYHFPYIPSIENSTLLYKLIEKDIHFYNFKIIFIVKLPLVDLVKFDIHKLTSMPVTVESDKFAFVLPRKPFLLVDRNEQKFMMMSQEEFGSVCLEIIENRYFCKQIQQPSDIHSSADCEINLFLKKTYIPDTCDIRKLVLEQPMFLQLLKQSSWIYVVPQQQSITVICGSRRHTVTLEGTGFISLAENCILRTSDVILAPLTEFTKLVLSNYSAPVNLTRFLDLSDVERWEIGGNQKYKHIIFPFDHDQLDEITFHSIDQDNYSIWKYCVLGLFSILLAIILGLYVHKHKPRKTLDQQKSPENDTGDDDANIDFQNKLTENEHSKALTKISVPKRRGVNEPETQRLCVSLGIETGKVDTPTVLVNRLQARIDGISPAYENIETQSVEDDPEYETISSRDEMQRVDPVYVGAAKKWEQP